MEFLNTKEKIDILEDAFAASTVVYYNVNLTHDLIPASMYRRINDKKCSLNEQIDMTKDVKFSDVILW